jgi:4-hydroxy-tetrahydrodipicolinate reductase
MKTAREFAQYFSAVEIIEMHHDGKLDSPSGTAIRTAELLAQTGKYKNTETGKLAGREILPHARGALYQGIPIHSVRLPGLLAHQQILFGEMGETLTLRHDTTDRSCFMPGLLLACKKVMDIEGLVFGLEQLI